MDQRAALAATGYAFLLAMDGAQKPAALPLSAISMTLTATFA